MQIVEPPWWGRRFRLPTDRLEMMNPHFG
jgi:hypothetical protein